MSIMILDPPYSITGKVIKHCKTISESVKTHKMNDVELKMPSGSNIIFSKKNLFHMFFKEGTKSKDIYKVIETEDLEDDETLEDGEKELIMYDRLVEILKESGLL